MNKGNTISVAAALTVGAAIGFALRRNIPDSRNEILLGKDLSELDDLEKEDFEKMIEVMNTKYKSISDDLAEQGCRLNTLKLKLMSME